MLQDLQAQKKHEQEREYLQLPKQPQGPPEPFLCWQDSRELLNEHHKHPSQLGRIPVFTTSTHICPALLQQTAECHLCPNLQTALTSLYVM